MNLVAVKLAVRRCSKVIFDVARSLDIVGGVRATLELVENGPVRFAHHLAQDVETAAVGHAQHDFFQAHLAAALDNLLKRRNQ